MDSNHINSFDYQSIDGISHFFISFKKIVRDCPKCSYPTQKTNGTQTTSIKHTYLRDRNAVVHLKKYRYVCLHCSSTFMTAPGLSSERKTISLGISNQVMEMAKSPNITFQYISEQLGISSSTAIKFFQDRAPRMIYTLPDTICVDEVYLGRKSRRKYAVVILDFKTGLVIDFIYGRGIVDCNRELSKYSRDERYSVKYVSTDMYKGFINTTKTMFPKAKICVDSFHVISLIIKRFDEFLKSVIKDFSRDSKEYYLLKTQKYLLMKNSSKISWEESRYLRKFKYAISKQKLQEMQFDIHPDIKILYELKERYIRFNGNKYANESELVELIQLFKNSSYSGFRSIATTLQSNFDYILNSFNKVSGRRISNGPIEAKNKTIKLILRNASGYRNEELLKQRVLYVLNSKK